MEGRFGGSVVWQPVDRRLQSDQFCDISYKSGLMLSICHGSVATW